MKSHWLLMTLGLAVAACGVTITHDKDVAAPQNYRPQNAKDQWRIEGELDTELERDDLTGVVTITMRMLTVRINGDVAVQGRLPADEHGLSTGSLDGAYQGAKVHVDCSSEQKNMTWVEIRCRVLVNDELGITLVM